MSKVFEVESFKNQVLSNLIPLYVMHRQAGLSESDALTKAREEIRFIFENSGLQEFWSEGR